MKDLEHFSVSLEYFSEFRRPKWFWRESAIWLFHVACEHLICLFRDRIFFFFLTVRRESKRKCLKVQFAKRNKQT